MMRLPRWIHGMPLRPISVSQLGAISNAFVVLGVLAVIVAAGLAIETLRIGGTMYDRIITSKNLVAEALPSPLYVAEAYHEVTRLTAAPQDAARQLEKLKLLRQQYEGRRASLEAAARHEYELKRRFLEESDREAQKFWSALDDEFLPALRAGDTAAMRRAYERIAAAYGAHRRVADEMVAEANRISTETEMNAERQKRWFLGLLSITTAVAFGIVIVALRTMQARVTRPLVTLAAYLKGGVKEEGSHAPFLEREDEIGVVARAIESFRFSVEQSVVEVKNAQLEGALDNIFQGVEMFDADGRLALCNERYRKIYGLAEADVPVGVDFEEVVAGRVRAGLIMDEEAHQLVNEIERARAGISARELLCELTDGRAIAISIQPMRHGGFVATHCDVTEQRRNEEKAVYFAHHDALTGLPNRMRLNEELGKALAYVRRGETIAVHALDLDRFKAINDTLGQPIGDKLLTMVAARLKNELREIDRIGRMGGDEFAVIERQISAPVDAVALANRLIETLSEPYDIEGQQIVIGTSVGVAVGPQDGETTEELLRNADLALYRAKRDGRGTFRFFEPAMDAKMQAHATLGRELRNALPNDEFELHYQPIISTQTGEICSVEALLRWRHPTQGLISPAVFIPIAEETGLIVPIGAWVLREACAAAARWPSNIKVAVNLSAEQFRSGKIGASVAEALERSGLAPDRLELEITESLLLDGDAETLETLYALRAMGPQITMDDFGTGYSSLRYLQSFPFDKIKIDKTFVQGIDGSDGKSLKIVRAMTALAEGLGMRTTAEGVESAVQLEAVRSEGCTEIQGFLMSKPLKLEDVEPLLRLQPGSTSGWVRDGAAA